MATVPLSAGLDMHPSVGEVERVLDDVDGDVILGEARDLAHDESLALEEAKDDQSLWSLAEEEAVISLWIKAHGRDNVDSLSEHKDLPRNHPNGEYCTECGEKLVYPA